MAGVPGVAGIHIEGPLINELRKGAHDSTKIRDLDARDMALLSSLQVGRTLVTLAPEITTLATITATLANEGVVIFGGATTRTAPSTR